MEMNKRMKLIRYLAAFAAIVLCMYVFVMPKVHAEGSLSEDGWEEYYSGLEHDEDGNLIYKVENNGISDGYHAFSFYAANAFFDGVEKVVFTSSDTKVAQIDESDKTVQLKGNYTYTYRSMSLGITMKKIGTSTITASVGDKTYSFQIMVVPDGGIKAHITSVKAVSHSSVKVSWKKVDWASGYIIARANTESDAKDADKLKVVKTIDSADKLSVVLPADYNVTYGYCVFPKAKVGSTEYYKVPDTQYGWGNDDTSVEYRLTYNKAKLTKVSAKGKKVTINWNTDPEIKEYRIYVKKQGSTSWKRIYTEKKASVGSYTTIGEPGTTWTYRVEYVFPEYKVKTSERSCYVVKKTTKSKKAVTIKLDQDVQGGQYGASSWCNRDHTYYYQKKNELHVVTVTWEVDKLTDYTLTKAGKVKSKKTVKLDKNSYWGGFLYGNDGCYYVAIGYQNPKHSKTKTVIKVMKYSSSWKLLKTCNIKGKEGNQFEGIVSPFSSGNCRMEMRGSKIYMVTSRIMFYGHHQSNISFVINTSTMKYKMGNEDYTSHSFNQYVRFDADNMYLVNHGDAYPRAVALTIVRNYGKKDQTKDEYTPFKIKGKTGYNHTGLTIGGLEVTGENVLIGGTSVPQNYKIKGVTGNNQNYVQNVFLTVTNKKTGKTKRKWLTTYHPKTSQTTVGEVRMVKLSDDYVALMYTSYNDGNGKYERENGTLHYLVLNAAGDVVYKKAYKNMEFTASSQPIVNNGSITWVDNKYTYKTVKWGSFTYNEFTEKPYIYRIPAITGK